MTTTASTPRRDEIRALHREYRTFYEILGGAVGVLALLALGYVLFSVTQIIEDAFSMNVFTETVGVLATVGIVDRLARLRAERERKEELIFQMGGASNEFAMQAARMLAHKGWLHDGSLHGAWLARANLAGIDLARANLARTHLSLANLTGADLHFATLTASDLNGATLTNANLQRANLTAAMLGTAHLIDADLSHAKLSNAHLRGTVANGATLQFTNLTMADLRSARSPRANLQWSNLARAQLQRTDFRSAVLQYANLEAANLLSSNLAKADLLHARFDEDTMLPDGSNWTPDTDMARFTDPNHPNFWQPEWMNNAQE